MLKIIVIDRIAGVINWSISYIKTVRGIVGALVVTRRTFSGIYPFNRALGGWM